MIISLIVAASTNNVIGKDNQLMWSLPNDMKFFKNTTWAMPVIMGRKTFDSLGKALNGRMNIVITRNDKWNAPNANVVGSLGKAIAAAEGADYREAFVIGGGEIFSEAIAIADRIYITRVDAELEGDAFFPEIDQKQWTLTHVQDFAADEKHAYAYHFQTWERIKH